MREGTGLELELSRSNSSLCCMPPQAFTLSGLPFPICQMEKINATFCLAFILSIFIVVHWKKKYFLICVGIVPNVLEPLGTSIVQ